MHSAVPTNFPPVLWHPLWILKAKTVRAKFASVAEAPEQTGNRKPPNCGATMADGFGIFCHNYAPGSLATPL